MVLTTDLPNDSANKLEIIITVILSNFRKTRTAP
jgi:hypothetical protein